MSTLQDLLNLGLVDIGSDDSRFLKIETAATALTDRLLNEPALLIPATLIAIDRDADEGDPIFTLVEEQLIAEWKTMRNTHLNRPRELLRSIIIHALSTLGADNSRIAAVISHTAAGPINHDQANVGKEANLLTALLQDFQKEAETASTRPAPLPQPFPQDSRQPKPLQLAKLLKDDDLLADVGRSAGPHDQSGTAFETPNPNWPNSGPQWSYDFTPRMTTALIKGVQLGIKRALAPLDKHLQSERDALQSHLTLHSEALQTNATQRLEVLWWFEAKYSPSLHLSYRDLPAPVASFAMAHDLSAFVPAMSPASVTYVLREAVAAVCQSPSDSGPWPLDRLLETLQTTNSQLRMIVPDASMPDGRAPLFQLVATLIAGNPFQRERIRPATGIDPGLSISLPHFSMWMFRDIQARRLVEELS